MSYLDFLSLNFVALALSTDLLVQMIVDYILVVNLLYLVADADLSLDAQHTAYIVLHPDIVAADYKLDAVDMAVVRHHPVVAVYTDMDYPVPEVDAGMHLVEVVERIEVDLVDSLDIVELVVDAFHQH